MSRADEELREVLRSLAVAHDALRLIARNGCERFTGQRSSCVSDYIRGAAYTAFAWCDACVASEALKDSKPQ